MVKKACMKRVKRGRDDDEEDIDGTSIRTHDKRYPDNGQSIDLCLSHIFMTQLIRNREIYLLAHRGTLAFNLIGASPSCTGVALNSTEWRRAVILFSLVGVVNSPTA